MYQVQLIWMNDFCHNLQKLFSRYRVKFLRHIQPQHMDAASVALALGRHPSVSPENVSCASARSESWWCWSQKCRYCCGYSAQDNELHDLTDSVEKDNWSKACGRAFGLVGFLKCYQCTLADDSSHVFAIRDSLVYDCGNCVGDNISTVLQQLTRYVIWSACFLVL